MDKQDNKHNFSSSPQLTHADKLTKRRLNNVRGAVRQAAKKRKSIDLHGSWVAPSSLTHHNPRINAIAIAVKQCMTASRDLAALANNPACSNRFRQELFHDIRKLNSKAGSLLTEFEDNVTEYEQQRASRYKNHREEHTDNKSSNSFSTADMAKILAMTIRP